MVMKKTPQASFSAQRKVSSKIVSATPWPPKKSPLNSIEKTFYRDFPYQVKSPDVKISHSMNKTGKLRSISINKDLVSSSEYERGVFGIDLMRHSLDVERRTFYGAIGRLPGERLPTQSFDSSKPLSRSASKQSNFT